jgi:hypothetical protein
MALTIDEIRKLVKEGKIQWRGHMLHRMKQRGINILDVLECIMNGEIIEQYENDYPYPSCLIFGTTLNNSVLHVVCAIGDGYVWMITAYFPSIGEWMPDYRTRREKR